MEDELMHELAAGYALDALDADEERAFEQHLAGCRRCREQVAAFSVTAADLAYAAPPATPPPSLRDRVLDAASADRNVAPLRSRYVRGMTYLAAAASIAAIAVGVWAATLQGRHAASVQALHGVPLHGANGSLVVSGSGQATLVVSGLAPAPAGKTYEAWVVVGRRAKPAGLFSPARGTGIVRLTRPVPRGAIVAVTLERSGGAPAPTGAPLVTSARV